MTKTRFLLIALIVLLSAGAAFAQVDIGLGDIGLDDIVDDSPFRLSWKLDRSAARPGGLVHVAIIFEVAAKHKIYQDKVTVEVPSAPQVASSTVIRIPKGKALDDPLVPEGQRVLTGDEAVILLVELKADASGTITLKPSVEFLGCSDTVCFPPDKRTLTVTIPVAADGVAVERINREIFENVGVVETGPSTGEETPSDFARLLDEKGYLVALPIAFGWGLLVSLTPCVWPLIPIVVAVVGAGTAGVGWRRGLGLSLIYVFGMSLTYAALGGVAGAVGDVTQTVATSPWVVGFVGVVFVALALSMFGVYDIAVPSSIAGRLQKKRAGLIGILVMGVLSGLVAGPCVSGPLLALMVGVAKKGSIALGALAGGIFGLGMGAILIVAGTSSKALQALPRSGGWMVSVKRFFGWVLLGAAIYVAQPLIGFDVYQTLLGALLVCGSFFMGIMDRTGRDTLWTVRVRQGIGVLVLVVGLLYFVAGAVPLLGFEGVFSGSGPGERPIAWVHDVEQGLRKAREEDRPALVDIWADWCTYCREMDRTVFRDPDVADESRRFVMIKADATAPDRLRRYKERYGVPGAPSFLFVAGDGTRRVVAGRQTTEDMLRLMQDTQ